jgi:hypothetical protein
MTIDLRKRKQQNAMLMRDTRKTQPDASTQRPIKERSEQGKVRCAAARGKDGDSEPRYDSRTCNRRRRNI